VAAQVAMAVAVLHMEVVEADMGVVATGLLHEEEDTAADTEGHAAALATALIRLLLHDCIKSLTDLVKWAGAVSEERQ
jgi:hypothetical protein